MAEFEDKLNAILGNQEAMGQIMALAQSLGSSGALGGQGSGEAAQSQPAPAPTSAPPPVDIGSALGELDPRMLQLGGRLLQEYQRTDDRKTALLSALRPFVKEERYERLDRAVQVARLSRVIRVLFQMMKEGDGRV